MRIHKNPQCPIFGRKYSFELKSSDKTCNFVSLYRSSSQSQDDLEFLTENIELNLENLVKRNLFLVVAGFVKQLVLSRQN